MPFVPFIGLSVIIHLCVIFVYWLFSWIPTKKEIKIQKVRIIDYITSSGIIFIIFLLVIVQAGFLVRAGMNDRHSSLKFISSLFASKKSLAAPKLPDNTVVKPVKVLEPLSKL